MSRSYAQLVLYYYAASLKGSHEAHKAALYQEIIQRGSETTEGLTLGS